MFDHMSLVQFYQNQTSFARWLSPLKMSQNLISQMFVLECHQFVQLAPALEFITFAPLRQAAFFMRFKQHNLLPFVSILITQYTIVSKAMYVIKKTNI